MIKEEIIEEVKKRLVEVYDPIAIYVFGSYAWGCPTEDSDLDLLIVVDKSDEKSYKRPVAGHLALIGLNISKDLIVKTKEEFEQASKDIATLSHKIKNDGELIYARA